MADSLGLGSKVNALCNPNGRIGTDPSAGSHCDTHRYKIPFPQAPDSYT